MNNDLNFRVPVKTPEGVEGVLTGTITGGPEIERWFAENSREVARVISDAVNVTP